MKQGAGSLVQYDLLVQSPTWRSKVKSSCGPFSECPVAGAPEEVMKFLWRRCVYFRLNLSEVPLLVPRVILDTLRRLGRLGSFRKHGVIDKVGFSCCSFNEADSGWSRLCSLGSSLGKTCLDFDMLAIHCGDQSVPRSQLIPELVS